MAKARRTPGAATERGADLGQPDNLEFVQVAFSGHRRDEDIGERKSAAASLERAFGLLADAGLTEARLLTGAEVGADALAVDAWKRLGLGPMHVVHPFLEGPSEGLAVETEAATRLPGAQSREDGRSPHLAQARWLIAAADILVVLWTGQPARGPGGTADVIRLALEHGKPVLWVQPGVDAVRLIRPERLDQDIGILELQRQVSGGRESLTAEATPQAVRAVLQEQGLETELAAEAATADVARPPRPAKAYGLFRSLLGGRPQRALAQPIPADLAAQPGFAGLSAVRAAAASRARALASIHRSNQLTLLLIAILAAATGSTSALAPSWKPVLVATELALALMALGIWLRSERGERHRRWTEARKLAEDLRLERAAWVVGISATPYVASPPSKAASRARRRAGLPTGAFDAARIKAWGDWVLAELITDQVAYHRDQARVDGRISHRVHQLENAIFAALILVLLAYLVMALAMLPTHEHPPFWMGGLVVMTGAVAPAIAAAGLALEATLSLAEQARRSATLADQLEALRAEAGALETLERVQALARGALRLHRAQEEQWSAELGRRRLFRGG